MNITQIHFKKLVSHGNYENTELGVTLSVGNDEDPSYVLDAAKQYVEHKLGEMVQQSASNARNSYEIMCANSELARINQDIELAKEKWGKVVAFLEKHGVKLGISDDIPF
jgi:hypothetical protein